MTIIRFGIDLSKNAFAVCGVDEGEQVVLRRTFKRIELLPFFAQQPATLVAMEAGTGTHHWARVTTIRPRCTHHRPPTSGALST